MLFSDVSVNLDQNSKVRFSEQFSVLSKVRIKDNGASQDGIVDFSACIVLLERLWGFFVCCLFWFGFLITTSFYLTEGCNNRTPVGTQHTSTY